VGIVGNSLDLKGVDACKSVVLQISLVDDDADNYDVDQKQQKKPIVDECEARIGNLDIPNGSIA